MLTCEVCHSRKDAMADAETLRLYLSRGCVIGHTRGGGYRRDRRHERAWRLVHSAVMRSSPRNQAHDAFRAVPALKGE